MKHRSQMMERCMRFMKEHGFSEAVGEKFGGPEEMCRSMMGHDLKTEELEKSAPPELRALFDDWLLQLEEEIIAFAKGRDGVTAEQVVDEFKISKKSATFLLGRLAKKGKINFDGISIQENPSSNNDG